MSTRSAMSKSNPEKDQQQREKQQRLSQALRDNLYRRKQQARSRKDVQATSAQMKADDTIVAQTNMQAPNEDNDGRS